MFCFLFQVNFGEFFSPFVVFLKRHLHRSTQGGVADVRGELLALTTLAEMHRSNGEISEALRKRRICVDVFF